MGQALYRKYRPKSLAELVGQEHITTALGNALKSGRISHAYLLTGPRGTGKTSIARILAHKINDLPYNEAAPLDIIEIDAASNRRIDEIRDLRDKVNTAPSSAKYKVYIIDEVHMLTKEAFNALLKTLEEPPAHVVFILATTEAHKLPETIISRTQRYSLRPVPTKQVVAHLKTIAKKEKILIDDDALELIAEHGEGSFRDSIGLLDQASNTTEKLTRAEVERMLGLAPLEYIQALQAAITQGKIEQVISTLTDIYAQGYEPAMVAAQLGEALRTVVLDNNDGTDTNSILTLLQRLLEVPAARSPKQLLELILLQASLPKNDNQHKPIATESTSPKTPATKLQPVNITETKVAPKTAQPSILKKNEETLSKKVPPQTSDLDIIELWQQTLNEIKKQYNTLYGIARMATPEIDDNTLTLHLKFSFHQKRLNEAKNRKILSDVVEHLSGRPIEIVCIVSDKTTATHAHSDVTAISNIFGGAELLES